MAEVVEPEVAPAFGAEVSGHVVVIFAEVFHPADAIGFQDECAGIHLTVAGSRVAAFDGEEESFAFVP